MADSPKRGAGSHPESRRRSLPFPFRSYVPPPLKTAPGLWPSRRDIYRAKLVFYLFLVSLAVFFSAGLSTYIIIRQAAPQITPDMGLAPLRLPAAFLASTVLLIVISVALQCAVFCIRRENQPRFMASLTAAWVAALAFLVVQIVGMNDLLVAHFERAGGATTWYGMTFVLAFLHALHVVGGLGFMAFVIRQGFRHRYDHERNYAVEHLAAYWHFLDLVWVALLVTFYWAT